MHTVASARVRAKKTQQQCADAIGLDVSNYNRREKGETSWGLEEAFKFCEFVNIPITDIDWFDGKEH